MKISVLLFSNVDFNRHDKKQKHVCLYQYRNTDGYVQFTFVMLVIFLQSILHQFERKKTLTIKRKKRTQNSRTIISLLEFVCSLQNILNLLGKRSFSFFFFAINESPRQQIRSANSFIIFFLVASGTHFKRNWVQQTRGHQFSRTFISRTPKKNWRADIVFDGSS